MSNQLQITGGAKVRNLDGVITGSTGVLGSLHINGANGIPQLDSSGKILVSQLPNSVMEYQGTWYVSTNTPYLVNGVGNAGDVYLVTGAATGGTNHNFGAGNILFFNGDQAIYDGSAWQRASGSTGTVTSVAITESGDALSITGSPITTSGTINIGFAGSSAQYVAGDGSLVTFPTIITEAQNLITEVYNETGATLTKGTIVYINGGHGNLPTVTKAIATGDATSAQTYGIIQADITNHNNGHVVVIGSLGDLDTQAYAAGTQLYLSSTTAGAWTSTKQYAPAHLVYVGIVVRSHPTQGIVEVRIQNGFELDELHNVSAQSPSNNDGIFYNSSNSLWENKSIATALGYTPVQGTGTTNYITKWTASGTIGNSMITDDGTTAQVNGSMNVMGGLLVAPSSGFPQATITSTGTTELRIQASSTSYTSDIKFTSGPTATYGLLRYDNSSNHLSLYSNSTAYARLFSNGNFAIGTTLANNGFKLEVEGTTKISGQLTLGSTISNGTYTYTLPGATGTLALSGEIATFSVVAPLAYFAGVLSMPQSSGSQNGYLSSTDWTTFNNKQNALGFLPIGGSGSINYISKFTGSTTISQSGIYEGTSGYVSIGNTNSTYNLDVTGTGRFTGALNGTSATFSGAINLTGTANSFQVASIFRNANRVFFGGDTGGYFFQNSANSATVLQIADGGAATFSSSVTAGGQAWINGITSSSNGALNVAAPSAAYYNGLVVSTNSYTPSSSGTIVRIGHSANSGDATGIIDVQKGGGIVNGTLALMPFGGSVCIGTTSPDSYQLGGKFVVAGSTSGFYFNDANNRLVLDGAGTNRDLTFYFRYSNSATISSDSYLSFATGSPSERMRITSAGNLLIGTTTDNGDKLQVQGGITSLGISSAILIQARDLSVKYGFYSNNNTQMFFYASAVGAIGTFSASTGVYTPLSDKNKKKDFEQSSIGLDAIMGLKPTLYRMKTDSEDTDKQLGFIAQEVKEVLPQAYTESGEGDDKFIGLNYNPIVAALVKAIQELKAEIDELKNK